MESQQLSEYQRLLIVNDSDIDSNYKLNNIQPTVDERSLKLLIDRLIIGRSASSRTLHRCFWCTPRMNGRSWVKHGNWFANAGRT